MTTSAEERAREWVGALVQGGVLDAARARDLYARYVQLQANGQTASFLEFLVAARAITPETAQRVQAAGSGQFPRASPPPPAPPSAKPREGVASSMDSGAYAAVTAGQRPGESDRLPPLPPELANARTVLSESDDDSEETGTLPAGVREGETQLETKSHVPAGALPDDDIEIDEGDGSDSQEGSSGAKEGSKPAADPTPTNLGPGTVLGSYTILGELGRGAMGRVFRAEHMASGEMVALKVLSNAAAPKSSKVRRRFRREVEALRRLHHDNIVRVHTYERTGTLDWYVMDLVEGRELKELILNEELEPVERLRIFEDVCRALAHAHDRGVIHRDLKPSNVLIDGGGHVYVLDFGLAKLTDAGGIQLTSANATLGTPYYMSPEQLTNPKGVTWKADIFALGVLLYELMTGQRPFEADTSTELTSMILSKDPARPSELDRKLGGDFDRLVLRALHKDPRRRYRRVEDLGEAVADYRRSRMGAVARLGEWLSTNGRGFWTGLLVATLIYLPVLVILLVFAVD